jgi:GMP synthase (glutamine-hydrolysing)
MSIPHPILVLRHEPFEHLGHFAPVLTARGIPFSYHDLHDPLPTADPAVLIILGGPMSANDAFLAPEIDLIRRSLSRDIPMLGICLGSQLIAKALGASVYRNPALEIGWHEVHLTEPGRTDPVFAGLESPTTFFHWHGETFGLPRGAEWLGWSDRCRHQAYRYRSNVYGIQFHPEITPEMIGDWQTQPVNCGDVATLDHRLDPHAFDAEPAARHILENWLSLVGQPVSPAVSS